MSDDNGNSNDDRRERQMEFIINAQAKFATDLTAEADERRAREAVSDRRLDRLENLAKLFVRAGRRERREGRERINALIEAQMRNEAIVSALVEAQTRDRENINKLADVVRNIAMRGDDSNGTGKQG